MRRIAAALAAGTALGAGACGGRAVIINGGDSGETSGGETGITTGSDDTTTTSGSDTSTSGEGGEGHFEEGGNDGVKFDLVMLPDAGPAPSCIDDISPTGYECEMVEEPPMYGCVELPPSGECETLGTEQVLDSISECINQNCTWAYEMACGPDPLVEDACCYWVYVGGACPGRPFLVDGTARLADLASREDWADSLAPECGGLDPRTREALAAAYTEQGLFEHASVASFARFVLELLAVGAPPELVRAGQEALGDELRHATAFFGLASAYAGTPVGPGNLDTQDGLPATSDLRSLALATAAEACIAETVSAMQLAAAHTHATDPTVRTVLARILEEELRHVELGWTTVGWALANAPELRPALVQLFADAERHVARGPALDENADAALLRAHGLLSNEERRDIARTALSRVVRPCAAALLARDSEIPRYSTGLRSRS